MPGNNDTLIAEGVSIAEAAEICSKILDTEKAIPCVSPLDDDTFMVTARPYSGGFRPYTRWPIRIVDHNIRFRVVKPYRQPEVMPFVYPSDRESYEELLNDRANESMMDLRREAEEREQEHEDAYIRTQQHIAEKLGLEDEVQLITRNAVPEKAVRDTIDSILKRGFFIDQDADDVTTENPNKER